MSQQNSGNLCAVAALLEAANCVWDGDFEKAMAGIARAVAILQGEPRSALAGHRGSGLEAPENIRGGLAAWQARRVAAYIDANLGAKIHIADVAELVGLSDGHFCRAFKRSFGVSAYAFLTQRRIEVARQLMLTTRRSLSDIALACRLGDQSNFTRTFRRIVGETPFSWRRRHAGPSGTQSQSGRSGGAAQITARSALLAAEFPASLGGWS